jgi:hypothetical protein
MCNQGRYTAFISESTGIHKKPTGFKPYSSKCRTTEQATTQ